MSSATPQDWLQAMINMFTNEQSSSTVSPPSNTMRGPLSFEKKMEEMKPSKRYASYFSFLSGPASFSKPAVMIDNKLGISLNYY